MNDRLYRSVDDRVLAGVCGGLAVRLALDPSLVRILWVVVALVTGLLPLLVLYVIMAGSGSWARRVRRPGSAPGEPWCQVGGAGAGSPGVASPASVASPGPPAAASSGVGEGPTPAKPPGSSGTTAAMIT